MSKRKPKQPVAIEVNPMDKIVSHARKKNLGQGSVEETIDCHTQITAHHFTGPIQRLWLTIPDVDKRVLQGMQKFVQNESKLDFTNAKIYVIGLKVCLVLHCGDCRNQYIATLDDKDKVATYCEKKGLRIKSKLGVRIIWNEPPPKKVAPPPKDSDDESSDEF
ncbi:uncharacterized protein LOC106164069 [Lingula anatina]|uniref:Uncharacterized protein LOC106164069 n=1 Tax=Lingula anatina TaxID=7574 RepID=A0A1S3IGC6_LINAN|nr:uncharacterized protein LOC106164069 [Lingula anatina]|eukprot:XP_013397315.1 uncharacterized protein LOC106164069 [Lingula anatina]